jgi:chemotaxis signal transduction protein
MDEGTRFLILSLDGGTYAIPITRLLEITSPRDIQKDPNLTSVFEGKFEYRGKWLPVLNVKKIFKLPGRAGGALLVIRGAKRILGMLVDGVREIIDTDQKPAPLPQGVMNPTINCYTGILKHKGELILLLNEDGLLE